MIRGVDLSEISSRFKDIGLFASKVGSVVNQFGRVMAQLGGAIAEAMEPHVVDIQDPTGSNSASKHKSGSNRVTDDKDPLM